MIAPPDQELRDDLPEPGMIFEEGTVGWKGEAQVADIEPGGVTLIRVTLRRGRTAGASIEGDDADGMQVIARLAGPDWRIMSAGTRCLVGIPSGAIEALGMPVLVKYLDPTPTDLTTSGTIIDHSAGDLTIRAGSSLTIEIAGGVRLELRADRLSLFGPLGNEVRLDQIGQILLGGDLAAVGVGLGPGAASASVTVKAKP